MLQTVSLISGIIYMVMQIFQHRWMWYFDIITCGTALAFAAINTNDGVWAPLWAQAAVNAYYIIMAVIGIFNWRRLEDINGSDAIHVVPIPKRKLPLYGLIILVATPAVCALLAATNDPAPIMDGLCFALSMMAAWFLTCSFLENWYLWIAADAVGTVLFIQQGAWGMATLYFLYMISAVAGLIHWKRNGSTIQEC